MDELGSAELLAIFTVFVILSSLAALNTFESGYTRQIELLQERMAVDTTRAVALAVEAELNDSLRSAVAAAMFEAGKFAGSKAEVESRLRNYFNQRIAAGWSYSNFDNIYVPLSDENSLQIEWLPDGGVRVYGYLGASFSHVSGAKAFGVKLDAGVTPRYGRMLYLANLAYGWAQKAADIEALERELNENYAAEMFSFHIYRENGALKLTITELYGGRAITPEGEG
ncbi:MAG: hypothetical protein ACP5PX_01170 [Candidatus Hadarchaeum sp.]|uniref:hypothetical protein n=1 Tax=Candidatus Hadarchaeum sp. TaxID=2883567 RepID=UPI003D0A43D7